MHPIGLLRLLGDGLPPLGTFDKCNQKWLPSDRDGQRAALGSRDKIKPGTLQSILKDLDLKM
jgi:hypothetical protein